MRQISWIKGLYRVGLLALVLLMSPQLALAASGAETEGFTPNPGLRIFATGILGSDGTRFEKTLVTAKLDDEEYITAAEVELSYSEYGRQPMRPVPKDRAVWRYAGEDDGIVQIPLVTNRGQKKFFWLPMNVEAGVQWKAPWGRRREIMETGLTVETPAGRFTGCIMVEYDVYAGGTGIERHYIAPGVGLIKIVSLKGPQAARGTTWFEVQRIEKISLNEAARIVSQMLE